MGDKSMQVDGDSPSAGTAPEFASTVVEEGDTVENQLAAMRADISRLLGRLDSIEKILKG